jgi:hypothetical protein
MTVHLISKGYFFISKNFFEFTECDHMLVHETK